MNNSQLDARMRALILHRQQKEIDRPKSVNDKERLKHMKEWTTFYRRNLDEYCVQRLAIPLKPFQRIMLHEIGESMVFNGVASRGIGKSFIAGCATSALAMIYPKSEIILVSSTIPQAKIIYDKIENELCGGSAGTGLSPVMQYLYRNGYIKFINSKEGNFQIVFTFNGSTISVLPPIESSRGHRATCIFYDEYRLMKKKDLESIFEGMLHRRQSGFTLRMDEKYSNPMYYEQGKSCYISSSGWKSDWLWNFTKKTFIDSTNSRATPTAIFASDIFLAVEHGLKTPEEFQKQKSQMSESTFRMEMLNEVLGEAEDSYFKLEEFRRNQGLQQSYVLPTLEEYLSKAKMKNPLKQNNEWRIMFIDFAMTATTSKQSNDNTVIGILSCVWKDDHLERRVVYMETLDGGAVDPVNRIKEMYYDIGGIDYIVYDSRNGGDVLVKEMVKSYTHPKRGVNFRGFTVAQDDELQVVQKGKLEYISQITVDVDAIPCLIPIVGSAEFNSNMWMELKKCMQMNTLKFLMDESEFEQMYETKAKWYKLTPSQRARFKMPFGQTAELCQELINLIPTYRDGKVKLDEPATGYKDRAVSLAYGNFIATRLENKLARKFNCEEYTMDDWVKALL